MLKLALFVDDANTELRNFKRRGKLYKVKDREGFYEAVAPSVSISFRFKYPINGPQETMTFGPYGVGGITLDEVG